MRNVICVWKEIGITPFQLVEKVKQRHELKDKKIGFAGRLDPMAEGIMILLIDEENKKRKDYEKLPKVYEFEVLLGISTDTYDVMGMPTIHEPKKVADTDLTIKPGKFIQEYPPYSYVKVNGRPLYFWARKNKLHEIEIPKKQVEIYKSNFIGSYQISFDELLNEIKTRIKKVKGDFRQPEIISSWEALYKKNSERRFNVYKFGIECSSGTYVRSISHEIAKSMETGALAYRITRTRVGNYVI